MLYDINLLTEKFGEEYCLTPEYFSHHAGVLVDVLLLLLAAVKEANVVVCLNTQWSSVVPTVEYLQWSRFGSSEVVLTWK